MKSFGYILSSGIAGYGSRSISRNIHIDIQSGYTSFHSNQPVYKCSISPKSIPTFVPFYITDDCFLTKVKMKTKVALICISMTARGQTVVFFTNVFSKKYRVRKYSLSHLVLNHSWYNTDLALKHSKICNSCMMVMVVTNQFLIGYEDRSIEEILCLL